MPTINDQTEEETHVRSYGVLSGIQLKPEMGRRDQGSHLVFYLCCMGDSLKQDTIELDKEESGKNK